MSIWEYSFVCIRYQTIAYFDFNVYIILFLNYKLCIFNNLSNRTFVFYVVDPVEGEGLSNRDFFTNTHNYELQLPS